MKKVSVAAALVFAFSLLALPLASHAITCQTEVTCQLYRKNTASGKAGFRVVGEFYYEKKNGFDPTGEYPIAVNCAKPEGSDTIVCTFYNYNGECNPGNRKEELHNMLHLFKQHAEKRVFPAGKVENCK